MALSVLLSALLQAASTPPSDVEAARVVQSLVRVELTGGAPPVPELQEAEFDIVHVDRRSGFVELLVDATDRARLDEAGIDYSLIHRDLTDFYAQRLGQRSSAPPPPALGAWLTPPFGQGSMGGYYTLAELNAVLDQIVAAYPALVAPKLAIGTSVEGRTLWALQVTDNPGVDEGEPEVRFDALHHGREPQSMQTLLWSLLGFLENYGSDPEATWIVNNRELWFVPCVNPDGYEYNRLIAPGGGGLWRKNRRDLGGGNFGVDLNRNYPFQWGFDNVGSSPSASSPTYRGPSAASEPEVSAMVAFLAAHDFALALTCHAYGNSWLYPWGYVEGPTPDDAFFAELSGLQTEVNGYAAGIASLSLYRTNGTADDHDYGQHGTLAWTPEIGTDVDGFWPSTERIVPLAEENRSAFVHTALAAGEWVRVQNTQLTEVGDGNGFFEAGESVELRLTLRNSGREGGGAIALNLTCRSPHVTITTSDVSLGPLASFTSTGHTNQPLSLQLATNTPPGAPIRLEVTLAVDGRSQAIELSFIAGVARDLLVDPLELDLGWQAGLPSDTATAGLWEFGDPKGTSVNGTPSNPEDDATPDGTRCFTTGNGATSAGGDDVDDGATTLISPRIDLAGAVSPVITYARWFADLGLPDDAFEVSISNDDGASWTPVETLERTANAWTRTSIRVDDYLAPSAAMRLRFVASDAPDNSIVEAAVDDLVVTVHDPLPRLALWGVPEPGRTLAFLVAADAGAPFIVYGSAGTTSFQSPLFEGVLGIDPTLMFSVTSGTVPGSGPGLKLIASPNDPSLVGQTFYLQALVVSSGFELSNRTPLTFE